MYYNHRLLSRVDNLKGLVPLMKDLNSYNYKNYSLKVDDEFYRLNYYGHFTNGKKSFYIGYIMREVLGWEYLRYRDDLVVRGPGFSKIYYRKDGVWVSYGEEFNTLSF